MDLEAYRTLQDSAWVRRQRDRLASGAQASCPIDECGGPLEPFDVDELRRNPADGVPTPGGVRCGRCGARSRPVAL